MTVLNIQFAELKLTVGKKSISEVAAEILVMKKGILGRTARFLLHFSYLFLKLIVWKMPFDVLSFSGLIYMRKLKNYVMCGRASMFQKPVMWPAYKLF